MGYSFDRVSLAISASKEQIERLVSGEQIAILKNTRTPFTRIKCYLYENKSNGGRGLFVATGEIGETYFYRRLGSEFERFVKDCCLGEKEIEHASRFKLGSGIVFYLNNIVEVNDPEELSKEIRTNFLIDPPKSVTKMKKW